MVHGLWSTPHCHLHCLKLLVTDSRDVVILTFSQNEVILQSILMVSSYQGLEACLGNGFESVTLGSVQAARLKSSADPTCHLVFVANLLKELSHSTLPWVGHEFWSENSMAGSVSWFSWLQQLHGRLQTARCDLKANFLDIQQLEKPGWQLNCLCLVFVE